MFTIFFDSIIQDEKIRFALFGNTKMMKPVRTKEIADFSFLTPQNPNYDFRLPAYREDKKYGANPNAPVEFTDIEKMKLRNAAKLAMVIVADGYQAMCNYLRCKNDPDNHDVLFFEKRVKAWFGCNTENFISWITPKMRLMQDTLQDRETFITFVNARNQRIISCTRKRKNINMPNMEDYINFVDFYDFNITPIRAAHAAYVKVNKRCEPSIGMGIKIYINELCKSDHIGDIARGIIHELSHKILLTEDYINDVQQIYGAEDCRKLSSSDPKKAITIADNWAFFYMSFGCYPDQQEYAYQAEYEITASDKGRVPSRVCNIIKRPKTYKTFNDLEAEEEIAAGNEPKRAKELRVLKAHISRREYLDSLTAGASLMCIKKKEKKKGYLERKELFELKERMEYKERLTNIEPKTSKELKKLKKQAEHLAYMGAMDSREGRQRRQRMARLARMKRR